MSMDVSEVGVLAASLMDSIAEEYGDDCEIGTVAVVVEINHDRWSAVRYRCNDGRRWVQAGFFEQAKRGVRESEYYDMKMEDEEDDG